jgi:peptidoglycan/LPS O-acetylase OafA/YrhL
MGRGRRIEDIEVLRAVAVVMVIVHHSRSLFVPWGASFLEHIYPWFNGDHGVDLFFAISGFVIARDLLPRLQAAGSDGKRICRQTTAFWIRKAFRLLPSAWLCPAAIVLASIVFADSAAFGSVRTNVTGAIAAVLQVANIHFMMNFGSQLGLGAIYHFWSLSLEEQFYIPLPLLVLVSDRTFPWIAGVLVLVQLTSVRPTFYYWIFRADALFLGVLLAWWSSSPVYARCEPRFLGASPVFRLLAFLLLAGTVAWVMSDRAPKFPYGLSVVAIASAALVYLASFDRGYLLPSGHARRALLWAGSRSYALYLWHVPVFGLVRELGVRAACILHWQLDAGDSPLLFIAACALLCVASEANFHFVEVPLRRCGVRIAQRWAGTP